ncbi:MAG: hypothetical protein QG635_1823 [Bacteroidota bacterium]|nr:hypothetical protein [Bacteroidota bacterium]
MTDNIKKNLPEPPPAYRWIVLIFISLAMFGNYYIYDTISPLADLLVSQLKFTDSDIGLLQGIYSIPNILMVLIGGLVIDRIGTKRASLIFSTLCMLGAFFTVIKGDIYWMAAGRLIFGLGAESLIVAITTVIARWFKGKELSFAFGLNLTIARLGSFAALNSPSWGKNLYLNWQDPLWVAFGAGVISVISVIIFFVLDKIATGKYTLGKEGNQDQINFREILKFNKSFWLITLLCVTFYSAMFPFQTFAVKFFIGKHFSQIPSGMGRSLGSFLSSILTLSAMILTPLFGLLADKIGKRATLMMFGSILIIPVYLAMNYIHIDGKIPEDTLKSVYLYEEILKENTLKFNEMLSELIPEGVNENEFMKKPDYQKRLAEYSINMQNEIDSLKMTSKSSVVIKNNKLDYTSKKSMGFGEILKYYYNLVAILILYFPNLLIPMILMGISFSLVPAVMWPSVALIIKADRLGTAYGLMTMIQNIGLAGFNILIGTVNDASGGYSAGMWLFSTLGFFGFAFAFLLKKADKSAGGHGLENVKVNE